MPREKQRGDAASEPRSRRADARRNIETILDAAERCLAKDPDASMSDIADAAGLGRVTLYGHFDNRAELIEIVVRRVLDAANKVLVALDLTGDAEAALVRLVEASWQVTVRSGSIVVAAEKALPPRVIREAHAGELEDRVKNFLAAGQRAGTFRSDLPTGWLVAVFHATLHAAASEISARRLPGDKAASVIAATLLGAYRPPTGRAKRAVPGRARRH